MAVELVPEQAQYDTSQPSRSSDSVKSVNLSFPFDINPDGLFSILTSDCKDEIIFDFFEDAAAKEMLEIETRGGEIVKFARSSQNGEPDWDAGSARCSRTNRYTGSVGVSMVIRNPGHSLSAGELARVETLLGVRLPDDYRSFLQTTNGGWPVPDLIHVLGAPNIPTDVQVFFGVDRSVESSNLLWNRRVFAGRLPASLLPIACDSGDNLFCLTISGAATGTVTYLDFDREPVGFYVVGPDFSSFVGSLTVG